MTPDPVVGLEMAAAVADLADTAMLVLDRRHEHSAAVLAREQEMAAAQDALDHEKAENDRLRCALGLYHKVLGDFQRHGLLDLLQQFDGLDAKEFQERLKKKVESREFFDQICSLKSSKKGCSEAQTFAAGIKSCDRAFEAADADDYVFVTEEDIYDGVACFLAKYVSTMPKAKDMSPEELQEAMAKAFVQTKKGTFKKLWSYGKIFYTAASWTVTVVGIYRNPIIIRTTFIAIWTTICILLQFLK